MAKSGGMGANLLIGGYTLGGDIQAMDNIHGGPTPWETTDITQSAFDRIGLHRDGGMEFTAYHDVAANAAHARLSTLPTTDVQVTYLHGSAIGNPAACTVAKQINYDGSRSEDGSFTLKVSMQSTLYGVEWGEQATAGIRTDTTATVGSAFDSGAGTTNFGLQAYLHVTSVVGTSVTVKLQESSDNGADAYADVTGGAFSAVLGAAVSAQRIATATNLAVERYLKVTTTGTFTSAVFTVVVVRNLAAPTF